MYRKFTASRVSESNVLFPPTIIFNDEGITIKTPALLHHNTDFIPYEAVSSVMIHTPFAGFSTITPLPMNNLQCTIYNVQLIGLGANCTMYIIHCTLFLVREMKRLVEGR